MRFGRVWTPQFTNQDVPPEILLDVCKLSLRNSGYTGGAASQISLQCAGGVTPEAYTSQGGTIEGNPARRRTDDALMVDQGG